MNIMKRGIIGVVAVLLASAVQTFGIEGLKLSVHCPDVWLSWPSAEGEHYIVQWRQDLSTNSTWVTLTNLLPAEIGTNITTFVHSNRVDCPTGQIFGMMASGGGSGSSSLRSESEQMDFQPGYPTVFPKDGLRVSVPLGIFPPGLDLSGYIIIWPDGSTDEWSEKLVAAYDATREQEVDGPQPEDAGAGSPGCGFYQVVRDGVHVVSVASLTNGVLSGTMDILIEAGNADSAGADVKGVLNCAMLIVDGEKFAGDGVLGAPPAYPWHFNFDTAYLENGDHTVQVQVLWTNPDSTDNNNQFLERYYDLSYYQKSGLRPAVFCGYKATTYYAKGGLITVNGVTYDDQIPWQVPGFITNYLFAWDLLGYGVFDSFVYSYLNLPDVQGWSVQPWDGLVIYGFEDLRIDEFNHKSDWP